MSIPRRWSEREKVNAMYEWPVTSGGSKLMSVSMRMVECNATPHPTQHDAVKRDVRTAQPGYVFSWKYGYES